jgi:hypothetical protein
MQQASWIIGGVQQTAIDRHLLRIALGAQLYVGDPGVKLLPVTGGKDHISLRFDVVGGSIGAKGDGRLVR